VADYLAHAAEIERELLVGLRHYPFCIGLGEQPTREPEIEAGKGHFVDERDQARQRVPVIVDTNWRNGTDSVSSRKTLGRGVPQAARRSRQCFRPGRDVRP
jgi:hypothetical protein